MQRDQDYAFNPVQDGSFQLPAHLIFFFCLHRSYAVPVKAWEAERGF